MLFEGFERRTVGGIQCVIAGKGPPVLMLHGFPQCLAMWARTAPKLTDDFTIVCADLRGYGGSHKPEGTEAYAFRAMAQDQVALMSALGFDRFHLVGHDRGGRTGHRMALDHPGQVASLTVMDIVPTYVMFTEANRKVAGAYWHWYFLSQPHPFPERMISANPDFFYETCLLGWGATRLADFDPEMLAEYRRAWRDPEMIRGSCADYRAAVTIDLEHDTADQGRKVACPALVFWGSNGVMHRLFDMAESWRPRCNEMRIATLPGGHFFVDQFPDETAQILADFLKSVSL